MKKLQIARIGYNVISIVFILAALLYLLFPQVSSFAACLFSGLFLLAYGCIKIIGYFSADLFCLAFRYDLAFGILLLVIGAVVLVKLSVVNVWLPTGIGWLALLDSVTKIQMSQEAKKFGLEQWGMILTTAIICGTLSVFLIFQKSVQGETTNILAALVLLSVGIMNLCVVKFTVQKRGASPEYKQL